MHDYDAFSFDSKAEMLEKSAHYWNPDKTKFWSDSGIDLVIDRREGYLRSEEHTSELQSH